MKFTTAFILLATLASAAPAPTTVNNVGERDLGLTKIPLAPNPNPPSLPNAIALAQAKYGARFAQKAGPGGPAPPSSTGSVPSTIDGYDVAWLTKVQIGTPAQTLNLDFDTGSSDLWVISSETSTSDSAGHNIYNPSKSSTWKQLNGYSWSIAYGDKSTADGDVGTDVVSVGGVAVKAQAVEIAKDISSSFAKDKQIDGLLGLAFDNGNTVSPTPQKTFISNLKSVLPSGSQLFTTAFYGVRSNTPSYWTWGYVDQNLVKGQTISWTTVNTANAFWQFPLTRVNVNGKDIRSSGNAQAIADTGTTLALLDDNLVAAIYKAIPGGTYELDDQGNKNWYFPNSALKNLPPIKVDVGGTLWTIQPQDLIFAGRTATTTYGAIQSNGGIGINILGDTFLKSVYAIWDHGNTRFGLVPKIQATQNLTAPPY